MTMSAEHASQIGEETFPGMVGVGIPENVTLYDPKRDESFGTSAMHVGNIKPLVGALIAEEVRSPEGTVVEYEPGGIRIYFDGLLVDPELIDKFGQLANKAAIDSEVANFLPSALSELNDFSGKIMKYTVGLVAEGDAEDQETEDPAARMSRNILKNLGAILDQMEEGRTDVKRRLLETMGQLNDQGVLMIKAGTLGPFGPLKTNLRSTALQESADLVH